MWAFHSMDGNLKSEVKPIRITLQRFRGARRKS
jgi:hypothetical protein